MKISCSSYTELVGYVHKWATTKKIPLLIVTSKPGLGKTQISRQAATTMPHIWVDGHITPLQLYIDLYDNAGKPVVFDDVDRLLVNQLNVSTLKSLCDSIEVRHVEYHSTTKILGERARGFDTSSPVLILCNTMVRLSANIEAIESRAIHLEFAPTQESVFRYVESWASDQGKLQWFRSHRGRFAEFTARDYAIANQLEEAGMEWRDIFLRSVSPMLAEVARLQEEHKTEKNRIENFSGSRATYYRVKAELTAKVPSQNSRYRVKRTIKPKEKK